MKKGDVFAIDLAALYPDVARKLRGTYGLVVSYGPAAKRDWGVSKKPHSRFVLADALFERAPSIADVTEVRPLIITHWSKPSPATYFIPDGPLPAGVTAIGTLKKLPEVDMQRVYSDWSTFAQVRHHEWKHVQPSKRR